MVVDKNKQSCVVESTLILLHEERYFEGKRVSQVIASNLNQILATVWDEPGVWKIDRTSNEIEVTLIEDDTNIEGNINCTDLISIQQANSESPNYFQYFIARTAVAINIVDTSRNKIYCLALEPNCLSKNRKTSVVSTDIQLSVMPKDSVEFQVIYVTPFKSTEEEKDMEKKDLLKN